MNCIEKFLRDENGMTAIEYALLAISISISIVAGATAIGTGLNAVFDQLISTLF
jgi:pilus assembly protein Flp/PilA